MTDADSADLQLNLTAVQVSQAEDKHTPLGKPALVENNTAELCQLTQTDYVSAYSYTHNMPLWSAFTLNNQVQALHLNEVSLLKIVTRR